MKKYNDNTKKYNGTAGGNIPLYSIGFLLYNWLRDNSKFSEVCNPQFRSHHKRNVAKNLVFLSNFLKSNSPEITCEGYSISRANGKNISNASIEFSFRAKNLIIEMKLNSKEVRHA